MIKFVGSLGIDYVGRKRRLTKNEWEHLQIKLGSKDITIW